MGGLERRDEVFIRPLVDSKEWDFCVVWKQGDDPTSGGNINLKEEESRHFLSLCRDVQCEHPIWTKACQLLASLPLSIPLYSGIHGEVAISTQPKWITNANPSKSNDLNNLIGTQVLIPVQSGLIELFAAKHVPKNEKLIKFIETNYNISMKKESIAEKISLTLPHSDFQKLSIGFNPSSESTFLKSGFDSFSPNVALFGSLGDFPDSISPNGAKTESKTKLKGKSKVMERVKTAQHKSRHYVVEKNRRGKLNNKLYALRALVPKITKMDKESIITDAIDYIREIQMKIKKFEDELKEIKEDEESYKKLNLVHKENGYSHAAKHYKYTTNKPTMETKANVKRIGERDFHIKFICKQKSGNFKRLVEAMDLLGIKVLDANVTTHDGMVLSILKAEAKANGVEETNLKDCLMKISG